MGKADIGKALSWAFDSFRNNAVSFLALAAVVFVVELLSQVSVRFANGGLLNAMLVLTLTIGFLLLSEFATIGVRRAALRTTQGHEPGFQDMLTTQYLGRYVVFSLAFIGLLILGFALCILPAFFVIFFLQLGPYYVLDKGMGATDAIRASFESIRTNIGPAAIMTILNVVALLLGSLFFGVATLIALPFVSLFTAHLYRQFNQEPVV